MASRLGSMSMLWFNFILGSNFIILCFKLIIIHYDTQKQKIIIKFELRIKLNHNINIWPTAHLFPPSLPPPNFNPDLFSDNSSWVRGGVGVQLVRYDIQRGYQYVQIVTSSATWSWYYFLAWRRLAVCSQNVAIYITRDYIIRQMKNSAFIALKFRKNH